MSRRVIDDRVVEMEFDNQNFEKNVSTSLSTLDKLKAALSFGAAGKEFDSVESSLGGLGKSFNLFEEIAIGAMRRIGSAAADWATGMIKNLSGVGNAIAGFEKFGDITKATGTLKGQGYALEEIETQLARLNWFTDETSFNLADMVGNIAKFTATGQSLEDSADAMMGIGLWAATAGQNAQTASRAMYQLSQAMSAGYMRKEDWKSIQNASMDTRIFRQHTLDAAVALGTLKKNADGTYQSLVATGKAGAEAFTIDQFTEKLTEGAWFTKDVMMDVYREYAGGVDAIYKYMEEHGVLASEAVEALRGQVSDFALDAFLAGQQARTWEDVIESVKDAASTGWMNIFQDLLGNYDDVVGFYTEMAERFYDIFVEPINKLESVFAEWAERGGQSAFVQTLKNIVSAVENVIWVVSRVFNKIVYGTTKSDTIFGIQVDGLVKFTNKLQEFTAKLADTIRNSIVFRRYVRAFLTIFDMGWQIISQFGRALSTTFGGVGSVLKIVFTHLSYIVREFYYLGKRTKANDSFYKFFTSLLKPLKNLKDWFIGVGTILKDFYEIRIPKYKKVIDEKLGAPLQKLKDSLGKLKDTFKGFWEGLFGGSKADYGKTAKKILGLDGEESVFDKLANGFYKLTGWEKGSFFDHVASGIEKVADQLSSWNDWLTGANTEDGLTGFQKIQNRIESVFDWIKTNFGPVWETVKGWLTSAFHWITENWDNIWEDIKGVASAVWGFISGIGKGFSSIFSSGEEEANEDGESFLSKFIEFAKKLGEVLGKVFGYLQKLLDPLITGLNNAMENLTFEDAGKLLAGGGLAAIGVAIAKFVSDLRASNILKGLNDLLGDLGGVFDSFAHSLDAKALKDAAIGVGILVGALFLLSGMPLETITSYGTALAGVIFEITAALKLLSTSTMGLTVDKNGLGLTKSGKGGFLQIAIGILLIAAALKLIAAIPESDIHRAAQIIETILLTVAVAMKLMSGFGGDKKVNKQSVTGVKVGGPAATLLAFALTIAAICVTLKIVADLVQKNATGFTVAVELLAGIFVAMTAFMAAMKYIKIDDGTAKTLVAFAAALLIISYAIKILAESEADPGEIQNAAMVIGLIGLLFIAMAYVAKNNDYTSVGKFAGSMILLAFAIGLVAGIIYLLSTTEGDIVNAGLVVAGIAAVFLVLMKSTNKMKDDIGKKLIKVSAGLIIFAVAVGIIAAAIYLLTSELTADQLEMGIGVLLAIVAAFGILIGLAYYTGDAVEKLGKMFMYIGITIAALAIGVYALVKALEVLSGDTINALKIGENIDSLLAMLKEKLPKWIEDILAILLGAVATFFVAAATTLINTFLDTIDMLKNDNTLSRLVNGVADLIIDFCDALTPRMPEIIEKVCALVFSIIQGIVKWMVDDADEIGRTLWEGFKALWDITVAFFDGIGQAIFGDNWEEVRTGLLEARDWFKENVIDKIGGWITDIINGIMEALVWLGIIEDYRPAAVAAADKEAQKYRLEEYYRNQYDKEHPNWMKNNENNPLEMSRISQERMAWVAEQVADALSKDLDVSSAGRIIFHDYWADDVRTNDPIGVPLGSGTNLYDYDKAFIDAAIAAAEAGEALPTYSPSAGGTSSGSTTNYNTTFNVTTLPEKAVDTIYRQEKNYMSRIAAAK